MQICKTFVSRLHMFPKSDVFTFKSQIQLLTEYTHRLNLKLTTKSASLLPNNFAYFFCSKKTGSDISDQKVTMKDNLTSLKEEEEEAITMSVSEQQTELSNHNKERYLREQHNYIITHIIKRVMNTCVIYLESPPEQRNSVKVDSRFYYVKKAIDLLEMEKEEEFKAYLIKIRSDESFSSYLTKQKISDFLKSGKYGDILLNLIFDFIQLENRDRLLDVSPDEDEVMIGKIKKWRKGIKKNIVKKLTVDLKHIQYCFEYFTQKFNEEQTIPRKRSGNYSFVYSHIFKRVVNTCRIYLDSVPEKRNSVKEDSRFYYVKQAVDKLSFEEEEAFHEYLKKAQNLVSLNKKCIIKTKYSNPNSGAENDSNIQNTQFYEYFQPTIRAKNIKEFLKDEKNGPILKNLLYEFMKEDNRDQHYDIHPEEDEVSIGEGPKKFKKRSRNEIQKQLTLHLKQNQWVFKKLGLD